MDEESRLDTLRKASMVLDGLGSDYTAAYIINMKDDTFETLINQSTNNVAHVNESKFFSDYLNRYVDSYVVEENRAEMKRVLRYDNLRKAFEEAKELYFRFESVPNVIGQIYFEAHAVKQYFGDERYAVIGFRCIDRIVKRDLEYQRKLDKAYKATQKQLEIVTSAIPGGVKISNDDPLYTFKYVSRQYAQMLGYDDPQELIAVSGGTVAGIAHPDDLERGISEALAQYAKGNSYAITYRMKCKDGSWKYIEDHGQKVINSKGVLEHWNLILDKNELVEKQIQLETERRAGKAKTDFLARMSHDIRTPLNGIIGMLEYNERHADDLAVVAKNRNKAIVAARYLLSLVNDILELNKLNEEKVTLTKQTIDLDEIFEELKTIAEMRVAKEAVTVHFDESCFNLQNRYVIGSPLHIKQIYLNIISNAIKYNRVGGSVVCSVQEELQDDGRVKLSTKFADTGQGMSESFQRIMFDPFAQEGDDARSIVQGSGLGLPIVKRLVECMNGEIEVKSELDVGTEITITLTFPLADKATIASSAVQADDYDFRGLKVLLVEDNDLNMEISKCILEDNGMQVTEARDGAEAVQAFVNSPEGYFDIVLMDVMMPVMNGYEASKAIRQLPRTDAGLVPIFAMTANAFAEDVLAAKAAGMNEHIAKPIEVKKLLTAIAQYMKQGTMAVLS